MQLDAPNLSRYEKQYLSECIDSGFISTFGPYVDKFEERFAKYIGAEHAVSVQSGTAAIHMALHELGIGPDDEVIVPASTFVATVNPIFYVGATPVFADVDIKTWNIDPQEIQKRITPKTKAIIPVHLYGNPCDMNKIMNIAKKNDIYVIEDSTESLGARCGDRFTGIIGDLGCFSFNGNKTITTGGGGMLVGIESKRLEHIRFLVNQAKDPVRGYEHPEIGFNYRMTNIEASLGLAQLERLESFLEKKRLFNQIYREQLGVLDLVSFQEQYEGADSSWWLSCIMFEKDLDISSLQKRLKEKGVPTRRIFSPIVGMSPYQQYANGNYKNSFKIYESGLCLPASTLNNEEDIYYICESLKDILSNQS
ncbi:MAG: aminotransferase class V-fold PLP-dependent enzyme [Planctomycetota bacterium]